MLPSLFFQPFPKRQILDASKLKDFADGNFKFYENGRKFSKRVENTVELERRNCSLQAISSFPTVLFKRLVLRTRKNKGLIGKRLNYQNFCEIWVYMNQPFTRIFCVFFSLKSVNLKVIKLFIG